MTEHKTNSLQLKSCDRCEVLCAIRYRICVATMESWQLVCPDCQAVMAREPGYRYGGTWKAKRRRS